MKSKVKYLLSLTLVIWLLAIQGYSQDIPRKPSPPRLVNDYANILSEHQARELENMLVAFNDTTSNQIVILLVNSFQGMDKAEFADRVGEEWGVGQKEFDNGIVMVVRPKTPNQRGEAWIAIGYGLEGAIPDAIANRIVDYEMIPHFKKNDYYTGLLNGTQVLMSLAAGEYSSDEYASKFKARENWGYIFFILFFFFIIFITRLRRRSMTMGRSHVPFWTALMLGSTLGGGRSSGSAWGGSSSGGFGGGGFGGFGGGSFGGGGAGGSW
jgi:uncharacterized protein